MPLRRQSINIDDWAPSPGSAEEGYDEKGYRLPDGFDKTQLADVRQIELAAEEHSMTLWSEFLPPLLLSVLTKKDNSEPLGLRFHEVWCLPEKQRI